MIIELKDEDIVSLKKIDGFSEVLKSNGVAFERDEKVIAIGEVKVVFDKYFFDLYNIEKSDSSIKPEFTIVDEVNKNITFVQIRTQFQKGSTDQKIPYGSFMLYDYVKNYFDLLEGEYDFSVAYILNDSHFGDAKYSNLLEYVTFNNLKIWINKIKI